MKEREQQRKPELVLPPLMMTVGTTTAERRTRVSLGSSEERRERTEDGGRRSIRGREKERKSSSLERSHGLISTPDLKLHPECFLVVTFDASSCEKDEREGQDGY